MAPSLNDVFYRYTEDPTTQVQQITQIITYGRPGTPMPAWGVAGGGPKNEQAVSDLVAYLRSIQVSPATARAQASKKIKDFKKFVNDQEGRRADNLADAQASLATCRDRPPAPEVPGGDRRRQRRASSGRPSTPPRSRG